MKTGYVIMSSVLVLAACRSSEDAMLRGDRYWADSNYVAALAEYRLAERQTHKPQAAARVAHAYIVTGQFERAQRAYDQLLKSNPDYEDQAVYDYVWTARANLQRGDRYGAARAAGAALEVRPSLTLPEMAITLARHYATIGDVERALTFYRGALEEADEESRPSLLYEIASLNERSRNCVESLPYFRAYTRISSNYDSITEARYRMGTCGLEQGRRELAAGQPAKALALLAVTLELGAPQNLLDQAWFERGEALAALGQMAEAEAAFQRVIELSAAGRSQLAARATRRLDELRGAAVP